LDFSSSSVKLHDVIRKYPPGFNNRAARLGSNSRQGHI